MTSIFHRSTNQVSIWLSVALIFVEKKASVRKLPLGSRTTTHLIATGILPGVYHKDTPDNISRVRSIPSYQRIFIVSQSAVESQIRSAEAGCFFPFLGFGPRFPGISDGGKS